MVCRPECVKWLQNQRRRQRKAGSDITGVVLAPPWRDCYIRTAVSCWNEGIINQPAELQQHSSTHQLIFFHSVLHFSTPLIYVMLRHEHRREKRRPGCLWWFITHSEYWCVGVAKTCKPSPLVFVDPQPSSARVAPFPRIINLSKQGGRQWFFVSDCVLTFL